MHMADDADVLEPAETLALMRIPPPPVVRVVNNTTLLERQTAQNLVELSGKGEDKNIAKPRNRPDFTGAFGGEDGESDIEEKVAPRARAAVPKIEDEVKTQLDAAYEAVLQLLPANFKMEMRKFATSKKLDTVELSGSVTGITKEAANRVLEDLPGEGVTVSSAGVLQARYSHRQGAAKYARLTARFEMGGKYYSYITGTWSIKKDGGTSEQVQGDQDEDFLNFTNHTRHLEDSQNKRSRYVGVRMRSMFSA